MSIHEVNKDEKVVVFIENLGNVNVNALKEVFSEIEVQESIRVDDDFDKGRLHVIKYIRKILEEHVVEKMDETTVLSKNAHDARVWDEGARAGEKNQMNWDGWRMNGPEIMNPYRE